MLGFLRKIWAIVAKDVAAELHTREILSAMLVFSSLALLVFSLALDLRGDPRQLEEHGVELARQVEALVSTAARQQLGEPHSEAILA